MKNDIKIYIDADIACQELMSYLRSGCFKSVCLVTGRSSFEKSGASSWLPALTKEFAVTHIETISADVKADDLMVLLTVKSERDFFRVAQGKSHLQ